MLPPRKNKTRSGIKRAPRREWPKHQRFVRSHACSVPGCQNAQIEFAHVRTAANAGTGLKPHDSFGISLCAVHHHHQHNVGVHTFEALYQINLLALAKEFSEKTTDLAMKESIKDEGT